MRVAVFTSYFLPHRGGVENYVYQTSRRLVKKGVKVVVVTSRLKGMKAREKMEGIEVVRVPGVDVLRDRFPVQLPVFDIGKVDVVVTHTRFYPLSFFGGMYAKMQGIPWIHVEHGTEQVEYSNVFVRSVSRFIDKTMGSWILKNALVFGVSKASCSFAKKHGAKKCSVLYNGVDCSFFDGRKSKHKDVRILFVGRLIKEKGVQDLIKAMEKVPATLTVVGTGPFEKEFKGLAGKNVKFVSKSLDREGIRKIFSEHDVFVNPSYGEGLPTTVLEAGAMGLAVIATDVGGTKEIIDDGKNGFLVKPADVESLGKLINKLVANTSLREKFGSSLQKKVRENFDWDVVVKNWMKVLK